MCWAGRVATDRVIGVVAAAGAARLWVVLVCLMPCMRMSRLPDAWLWLWCATVVKTVFRLRFLHDNTDNVNYIPGEAHDHEYEGYRWEVDQ